VKGLLDQGQSGKRRHYFSDLSKNVTSEWNLVHTRISLPPSTLAIPMSFLRGGSAPASSSGVNMDKVEMAITEYAFAGPFPTCLANFVPQTRHCDRLFQPDGPVSRNASLTSPSSQTVIGHVTPSVSPSATLTES